MLYSSALDLIGRTPTIELTHLERALSLRAQIFAKAEMFSLTGSVKDRIALEMIEAAEREGKLRKNSVIIEPTSGNTGIALAAVGAVKGYRVIVVMPDSMSKERIALIRAYGGEVVLTPGALGMRGAIGRAEEIASRIPDSFLPAQFENPANPRAHYGGTGPELERDLGRVDILVAGVGTGGTLSGAGRYLKERGRVHVVAAEPDESPVLSGGQAGKHGIQGIGAGFVPKTFDSAICDEIIRVKGADAAACMRKLARTEGLFCGISSGAALFAALSLASRQENAGKRIAVILPDTGMRYLSVSFDETDRAPIA